MHRRQVLFLHKEGAASSKSVDRLLTAYLSNLRLSHCNITVEGCAALSSALTSNPSHLRQLNLTNNDLGDSAMEHLSAFLEHPDCKLEELWVFIPHFFVSNTFFPKRLKILKCIIVLYRLCVCKITAEGCVALSSALTSNPSHLRDLNLSFNDLGDLGVKLISDVLENPQCKLEILKLNACNITHEGCFALTSALRSNPSHLTELVLIGNKLGDLGVKLISDLVNDPRYKLKKIRFSPLALFFNKRIRTLKTTS
ncbi:ribonuclease inhibitor-like [Misgurnus anguillicaudatus]|uniref:ribonuclease inhibitor-like n=1 Tax=Misgurnus anguillicaudatus TaxID=75329 RepID=UPI003CCF8A81